MKRHLRCIVGIGFSISVVGCGAQAQTAAPPPAAAVSVAKPLKKTIVEWDDYTGRLDALESVDIRSRVSGYLMSTHFDEGQIVQQGALLAIIDPRPFEAEFNAAKARREEAQAKLAESQALLKQAQAEKESADSQEKLAKSRLRRAEQLRATSAASQEELDMRSGEKVRATAGVAAAGARIESAKAGIATARAAVDTAKANVESARLNLLYTQIRAPITGLISRRLVTKGNLITGGGDDATLLTTIVSINPIHVYFDANEQEFLKYTRLAKAGKRASSREVKNPVQVALADEDDFPHVGHMDFVDNRLDPNTGTMRGRAILPNPDGLLVPGLFVKVRLPGSGKYDAILIPDKAIASDQSDRFVYVVNDDKSFRRQVIDVGAISHGLRIVRQGLKGDEMIVVDGLQRIYPGIQLDPTEVKIEAGSNQGLPDYYEPVPKEKWLTRQVEEIPSHISKQSATFPSQGDHDEPTVRGGM